MTARLDLLARWGQALFDPAAAMRRTDDDRHAGRSATDLLLVLAIALLVAHTRALVAAGWILSTLGSRFAMPALTNALVEAATLPLVFVVLAAPVITLFAGARRDLGRDVDLACVAALPPATIALVASTLGRYVALGVAGRGIVLCSALAWGAFAAWHAIRVARARAASAPPAATGGVSVSRGKAIVAAIATIALAINVVWIARHLDWLRPLEAGHEAPPLDLPRIGAEGRLGPDRVTLASLRGDVVVVEFWATWCGPCLRALPVIDREARAWGDRVTVLAVNTDDPGKARALFDVAGWRLTLVADDGDAADRYGVQSFPHTVVIDRAGTVRLVARGGQTGAIAAAVARLLAEPLPPSPSPPSSPSP